MLEFIIIMVSILSSFLYLKKAPMYEIRQALYLEKQKQQTQR